MKSDKLPLFKSYEEWYKSPPISIKAITEMCEQMNSPSFRLIVTKNKYKEDDETRPDYVFYIVTESKK